MYLILSNWDRNIKNKKRSKTMINLMKKTKEKREEKVVGMAVETDDDDDTNG